ncbi:sodium:proton antiporter [endosymbiont of Riftia pachyptila]|nr:NADH-quinone oxidoreductase subunit K [endosymbiont of Riftia pachyptila]
MYNLSLDLILYSGALGLIVIGLAGMVLSRHLFRVVLALAIAEAGANLLLVLAGYRWDAVAPILSGAQAPASMVDPVPQAMVLTAIVIGVGIQALAVSLLVKIRHSFGTLERSEVAAGMDEAIAVSAAVPLLGSREKPAGGRLCHRLSHCRRARHEPDRACCRPAAVGCLSAAGGDADGARPGSLVWSCRAGLWTLDPVASLGPFGG